MPKSMITDRYALMPWDGIDSVVFDVGNVLLAFIPDLILRNTMPGREALYPALKQAIFASPYWAYQDMGLADSAEAGELMAHACPQLAGEIRQVMSGWMKGRPEIPEGIAALEECRRRGKKTFVLSNFGDDSFAYQQAHHAFFDRFDGMVISSRVHLVKPDADIFRKVTDTYGLDPERTMFIDDSAPNIAAAMGCGWEGLWYDRPGRLYSFLGIKPE